MKTPSEINTLLSKIRSNCVPHCRFLMPGNTQKFLWRFDTIFGLKMMVKSGLVKIISKFHDGLQSCCCPVQKNLPRKAELAWQVSRYLLRPPLNFNIFFSKPLFTIILSQKWSQISIRIFVYCLALKTYSVQIDYLLRKFVIHKL